MPPLPAGVSSGSRLTAGGTLRRHHHPHRRHHRHTHPTSRPRRMAVPSAKAENSCHDRRHDRCHDRAAVPTTIVRPWLGAIHSARLTGLRVGTARLGLRIAASVPGCIPASIGPAAVVPTRRPGLDALLACRCRATPTNGPLPVGAYRRCGSRESPSACSARRSGSRLSGMMLLTCSGWRARRASMLG